MMWKTYKKEIMEKESQEKDFLKNYYQSTHKQHSPKNTEQLNNGHNVKELQEEQNNQEQQIFQEDDWPIEVLFFCCLGMWLL